MLLLSPGPGGVTQLLRVLAVGPLQVQTLGEHDALILPIQKHQGRDQGAECQSRAGPHSATYGSSHGPGGGVGNWQRTGQVPRGEDGSQAGMTVGIHCRKDTCLLKSRCAPGRRGIPATRLDLCNNPTWWIVSAILSRRGNQGTERGGDSPSHTATEGGRDLDSGLSLKSRELKENHKLL